MNKTPNTIPDPGFWPKYKPWIIGGAIVLLLVAGAAIVRASGKEEDQEYSYQEGSSSGSGSGGSSGGSGFKCTSRDYPLKYGTCHPDVKHLQRYLLSQGADLGSPAIDGKFGRKTQAASKSILGKDQFTRTEAINIAKRIQGGGRG